MSTADFQGPPRILSASTGANIITKLTSNTADEIYTVGSTTATGTALYGITGLDKATATQDGLLLRFAANGTNLHYRLFSGNGATNLRVIRKDPTSESVYIAGQTFATDANLFGIAGFSPVNANGDAFLIKYSAANAIEWSKTVGGTGVEDCRAVATDSAGNVYMVGETSTLGQTLGAPGVSKTNSNPGGYVVRMTPTGTTTWGAEYSVSGYNTRFTSVAVDSDNNVILAGTTNAIGNNLFGITGLNRASGATGILLLKVNPATNTALWGRIYNSSANEVVNAVVTDNRKNIYIAGNTTSAQTNMFGVSGLNKTTTWQDGYLVKFDTNATPQWGRLLQTNSASPTVNLNDLSIYPSGRLILSGSTNMAASATPLFGITGLVKTLAGRGSFIISYDRDTVANPWYRMLEGGMSDIQVGFLNQYKRLVLGITLTQAVTNLYGFVGANKSGTNTDTTFITYLPALEPPSPPIINERPKTRNQQITYWWGFEDWTTVSRIELVHSVGLTINIYPREQYYTFFNLNNGQPYNCSITSYNANETPSETYYYSEAIPGRVCQPPSNVVWTPLDNNRVSVTWEPPLDDGDSPVDFYVIQTPARQQRIGIEPWRREYTFGIPPGTHQYELRAICDTGYGNPALSPVYTV